MSCGGRAGGERPGGVAGLTADLLCSRPVPKHLHVAGNNGRYGTVQCRISHSALTTLLRDWSNFVLVEGYSYVKLMSRWASAARTQRLPVSERAAS